MTVVRVNFGSVAHRPSAQTPATIVVGSDGAFMATTAPRRPAFIPSIIYKDNRAALKWLQKAFGFEPAEELTDPKDNIRHAEMTHEAGAIMAGHAFATWAKIPGTVWRSTSPQA